MRIRRAFGILTRIVLLVPLVASGRVECGVPGAGAHPVADRSSDADCHRTSGAGHDHGPLPEFPRHHGGGPMTGHCPVYHSCALDFSFLARAGSDSSVAHAAPPIPNGIEGFRSLASLPEVPPPRV